MEEIRGYAVEARIFADGKIITKVRMAEPEEESHHYGTRTCEVWVDVFRSPEEAEDFAMQYAE